MKVIFDISVLGWSIRDVRAKTGIFRVIENLLFHFIKDSEIDLYISAIHGNYSDVREYLSKENLMIDTDHMFFPKYQSVRLDNLFQRLNSIEYGLTKIRPNYSNLLILYLFKILKFFVDFLFFEYRKSIPKKNRTKDYIFHSPFLPVPSYLTNSEIWTIVSIYDLIPVLYPEYFMGDDNHLIQKLVRTLHSKTRVLTISEHSRKDIISVVPAKSSQTYLSYLAANKVFRKRQLDTEMLKILNKYGLEHSGYFVSVSTLEPRKNLKMIIESFLSLENDSDNIKLVLVGAEGWGPSFDELRTKFGNGFDSKIKFLGFVPDSDLSYIYGGALFFVYMSFYEGFGLPPLEAMQCGLPVLCSNSSSLPEVIGDAGILVSPNDHQALMKNMALLISDYKIREELSLKSLRRAEFFTWEKTAKMVKEVYLEIKKDN